VAGSNDAALIFAHVYVIVPAVRSGTVAHIAPSRSNSPRVGRASITSMMRSPARKLFAP
jgi:hypothetical protein